MNRIIHETANVVERSEDDELTRQLEYGTTEYLVYDAEGGLVGSLGYNRSGTTDWLVLGVPDDEMGMICYTFFINN